MTDNEKLLAIAQYIQQPLIAPSDDFVLALGLSVDRWDISRYAGNPNVLRNGMADFLNGLAQRLGNESVEIALQDKATLDQVLTQHGDQLGVPVAGQFVVAGEAVKNVSR